MKIVSFIPVRGGSKSIPLKNIRVIGGKPLVFWSIDAALNSTIIQEIYISTDSQKIKRKIIEEYGTKVNIITRSPETATDTASSESALIEFCQNYEFDYVIFQQATSPLTTSVHINDAFDKFSKTNADSLLTVVNQKRFIWEKLNDNFIMPKNYDIQKRPRRQEFDGFMVENGAFYISSKENIIKSGCRLSGKICYYEMPEKTYFEIDEPSDWIIIEHFLNKRKRSKIYQNLEKIDTFILDIDGTLTDGGMYYSSDGELLKKFNTRDAHGLSLLKGIGKRIIIMTSEESQIVISRMKKLKINDVHIGIKNKEEKLDELIELYDLDLKHICYMGDDLNDLNVMKKVGFSACPNDAENEIKQIANYISDKKGGKGAVRDICNLFLNSQ